MSSSKSSRIIAQQCQRANWEGSLPITLSLAPTSLSSPTMPPSLHVMVSRQSYLHIGIEDEVRLLYKYAPSANLRPSLNSMSTDDGTSSPSRNDKYSTADESNEGADNNDDDGKGDKIRDSMANSDCHGPRDGKDATTDRYPVCWFEDEETGIPIRWHLFVGILYDQFRLHRCSRSNRNGDDCGIHAALPWKIRVHFTSYPTSLLPLQHDDSDRAVDPHPTTQTSSSRGKSGISDGLLKTISKSYLNSLKTALYVQHNSNRVSRRCMTKDSDLDLWYSIVSNNWGLYHKVCQGFDGESGKQQDSCDTDTEGDSDVRDLYNVPIRILVDGKPALTRACRPNHEIVTEKDEGHLRKGKDKNTNAIPQKRKMITVGEVLIEWLPHLFTSVKDDAKSSESHFSHDCQWCIQGIQIPWDSPIANLWRALSHPDRFLYIIVITNDNNL